MARPLTAQDRDEIWDLVMAGDTHGRVGLQVGRNSGVVRDVIASTGGVRPPTRRRAPDRLTVAEREEPRVLAAKGRHHDESDNRRPPRARSGSVEGVGCVYLLQMAGGWPSFFVGLLFVLVLVIDNVKTHRLRDVLSFMGLGATLSVASVCSVATGQPRVLIGSLVGAGALFAFCFIVEFVRPGTLGFGTVKSSALLGAASGGLGQGPWLASGVGLAFTLAILGVLSWRMGRMLPTGPALAVGIASAASAGFSA